MNQEITAPQVRLVDFDGSQAGIVPIAEALERALAAGSDLVEIAPNATPPVVKILDWGKFRYEQTKQLQKNRKSQRSQEVKQIRLGLKIGQHDIDVKARKAREFLQTGAKVKVGLRFRGREITHPDLGQAVLLRFVEAIGEIAHIEQQPQLSGREMSLVVAPSKLSKKPEQEKVASHAEDENS